MAPQAAGVGSTKVEQQALPQRQWWRWISNIYIVLALFCVFTETVPFELCPTNICEHYMYPFHDLVVAPITNTLGLWQVPWTMFSEGDDQNEAYEAVIVFEDGSREIWRSPVWRQMTWLERARHMRPMDYFEKLESHPFAWDPLARQLARRYQQIKKQQNKIEVKVVRVDLFFLWEQVPRVAAEELPLFVPVRQEMERGHNHLFTWTNGDGLDQRAFGGRGVWGNAGTRGYEVSSQQRGEGVEEDEDKKWERLLASQGNTANFEFFGGLIEQLRMGATRPRVNELLKG